jgi:hypothetical protein
MTPIILVLTAITSLVSIWMGYWGEALPQNQNEIEKLKRKRITNIVASFLLIIGLIASYIQFQDDSKEINDRLNSYRKIDTINNVGIQAKRSIDEIKIKSEATIGSLNVLNDSLNANIELSKENFDNLNKESEELIRKQKELTQLNKDLSDLSLKTYKNLTNYNSKPEVYFVAWKTPLNKDVFNVTFRLSNYSEYPIEGLKISLEDEYRYITKILYQDTSRPQSFLYRFEYSTSDFSNFHKEYSMASLGTNRQHISFYETTLPVQLIRAGYILLVEWRNGHYEMQINLTPTANSERLIANSITIVTENNMRISPDEYFNQPPQYNHIHDINFNQNDWDLKGYRKKNK